MAKDVITRFKLETTGFDSKIKQASKELSDYTKTATQAKEGFNQFTKTNVEAAKALGTMATSSSNAKQQAQELVGAYNDLVRTYNQLTKEQQQSDFGKAMAVSMTQLQQRIKDVKQEMYGMENAASGLFGGKLDGALSVFGGNLMTKGFELAAGAVTSMANEIGDCIKQGIQLAKEGEGIRIAFERLGRGDILDGLREATHGTVTDIELMKAAVKFNDFKLPVEELGTMLAFAQQKAKDTGQSIDYMVDSIVTGLGRKSLMILDNLGLSAAEIKDKMKDTGDMTKAVGEIIREQMQKAGDYVETAADRAAQANVSLQNKMEELGRKFAPIEEASNQLWTSIKIGILDIIGGPLARLLNGLTEAGRLRNALNDINGEGSNTQVNNQLKRLQAAKGAGASGYMLNYMQNSVVEGYNREIMVLEKQVTDLQNKAANDMDGNMATGMESKIQDLKTNINAYKTMIAEYRNGASEIMNPTNTVSDTGGSQNDTTKNKTKEYDELQKIQAKITELTKEAYTADEDRVAEITKEIAGLQAQEKKLTDIRDLVTGKKEDMGFELVNKYDTGDGSVGQAYIDQIKADLAQSNIDEDMAKLAQLMADGLRAGLQEQDMSDIASELKQKIAEGGDVPDEVWQELEEYIQENLDNADFSFKIDFESKNVEDAAKKQKKDAKEMAKEWQAAGSAIQAVGNAMQQIEDPAAKVLGTIAQAVATMALSYAQAANSKAVTGTGWGWIAFAATGLATMLTSIAAIKQATAGFANGGIVKAAGGAFVPGNNMSGDMVPAMLNSGELVLNKAQQGNLASQLEGNGLAGMQLETRVNAEEIIFVLNNNANRRGYKPFIND